MKFKTLFTLAFLGAAVSVSAQVSPPWGASPFSLSVETAAMKASTVDVRVALSFPDRHVVYAESFRVSAAGKGDVLEAVDVPKADQKPDLLDPSKRVSVYPHSFESVWRLRFATRRDARLRVEYQGCDDKVCFMPQTHTFRIDPATDLFVETDEALSRPSADGVGRDTTWLSGFRLTTGGGYLTADEFLAFLDQADGKAPVSAGGGLSGFLRDPVSFFHAHGLALTLLLVLVGGVFLNLTPCVLPMIPVNLAIIGAGAGTRERGFVLGSAYGAGIVLVYGGMGWLILRSGLFFGALQASPWFSLTMALVFAALALALFDVFVIDLTRFGAHAGGARRQGVWPALIAGGVSALLAGACVAPVVLAVLLLAGTLVAGGSPGAQFLPFVLGLGMALPWPFAGAGLSVLPNPGKWMVRVKQAFGVFLVLLALYYGYLAAVGFRPSSRVSRDGSILAGDRAAWEEKLAQAKRDGKPVFIDFWATWCKNCSAMEKTTFQKTRVKARLAGYVVVKVQAEKPDKSPAKEMLDAFKIRGLPGFAVLKE
jgi:thiol:disulfide interchange protein